MPRAAAPRRVEFHRTKYGRELLADAAYVRAMPEFLPGVAVAHVLTFPEVLLVTGGRGSCTLDAVRYTLAPGTLLVTRPGQVRLIRAPGLQGACLFFTEEFVAEAFSDPRFLEQFAVFRADRPEPALTLTPAERRVFLQRFAVMRREIAALRADTPHALRATLYDLLVRLDRWYTARHPRARSGDADGPVARFRALLDRNFARRQRVADYADAVGLTPGHLSALCRTQTGRSAGALIRARLALEARRLLAYGELPVAAVADRLGFEDPAYFARFFRREVGTPPAAFRRARRR